MIDCSGISKKYRSEYGFFQSQNYVDQFGLLNCGAHLAHLINDQDHGSETGPMGDLGSLGPMWIGPSLTHHPLNQKQ